MTVIVCGVFQVVAAKVSGPLRVTSGLLLAGVTVAVPGGCPVSTTV